jgi:hypothetical protein
MKLIKEIKSKEGVLHFKRWQILSTPFFSIYIHGIYHHDEDRHLHNHPWNIWTMILWGSYWEEIIDKKRRSVLLRTPLSSAYRNSERFHKIKELKSQKVYTLAIVGRRKKEEWGYMTEKGFVNHINYRENKNKK